MNWRCVPVILAQSSPYRSNFSDAPRSPPVSLASYCKNTTEELAMNNQLATHFRTYFQMAAADASALAGSFGLMNLFARSLGGITSDLLFKKFGFRGRIWAQFLSLFFEAVFLFCFGLVDNSQPWYVALAVLLCFSLFVQMAEGTSYGIVPFMNKQQLAIVSALVGAGGNLGAVIAGFGFYRPIEDPVPPANYLEDALWVVHPRIACGPSKLKIFLTTAICTAHEGTKPFLKITSCSMQLLCW